MSLSKAVRFKSFGQLLFPGRDGKVRKTWFEVRSLNPISGRLLATPISGRGGCLGPPLDISDSYRSIFKIQTAFVSPQHDLHF